MRRNEEIRYATLVYYKKGKHAAVCGKNVEANVEPRSSLHLRGDQTIPNSAAAHFNIELTALSERIHERSVKDFDI